MTEPQVIPLRGVAKPKLCLTANEVKAVIDPLRGSKDPNVIFFFERLLPGWENRIPPQGIKFIPAPAE